MTTNLIKIDLNINFIFKFMVPKIDWMLNLVMCSAVVKTLKYTPTSSPAS